MSSASLKKNFSWTFLGNVAYAASQWAVLIFLARSGSPKDVGAFALATALSAPIFTLANLKLRSVQASDALQDYPFGVYLALRMIGSALGIICTCGFAWFSGYSGTMAAVITMVAFSKALESISDIFHGLQQRHERMHVVASSLILRGALSILGFVIGMGTGLSLIGGILGLVVVRALVLVLFDIPSAVKFGGIRALAPLWSRHAVYQLGMLALPLGLTTVIGSLSSNVPRYFIETMMSTESLGIFAAVTYVMVAGTTIIAAIGQSATPRLARLYRTGMKAQHRLLVTKLLLMGGAIGAGGTLIAAVTGDELLRLIYGPRYAAEGDLFTWVALSAAISYSYVFLGTALTSMKRFNVQLPVHVVGFSVLVAACWFLIPRFGLAGAAWAMLISNLVQAVLYGAVFTKYFSEDGLVEAKVTRA